MAMHISSCTLALLIGRVKSSSVGLEKPPQKIDGLLDWVFIIIMLATGTLLVLVFLVLFTTLHLLAHSLFTRTTTSTISTMQMSLFLAITVVILGFDTRNATAAIEKSMKAPFAKQNLNATRLHLYERHREE